MNVVASDVVDFALGNMVYLKTAPTEKGMVTGIIFRPSHVSYLITWGSATETAHFAMELTETEGFA